MIFFYKSLESTLPPSTHVLCDTVWRDKLDPVFTALGSRPCHLPPLLAWSLVQGRAAIAELSSGETWDIFIVNKDIFAVNKDIFAVNKDIFAVNKDIFAVIKDIFTVSEDIFTVSEDIFTVSKDIFTVSKDIFTVNKDIFTVNKDIFTVNKDIFAVSSYHSRSYLLVLFNDMLFIYFFLGGSVSSSIVGPSGALPVHLYSKMAQRALQAGVINYLSAVLENDSVVVSNCIYIV